MDGARFIEMMRNGDPTVWDAVMPMIRRITLSACHNLGVYDSIKEDIVQDVALRVFTQWQSYSAKSSLSTWVYAIARNRILDELRKRAVRGKHTVESNECDASEDAIAAGEMAHDPKLELMLCIQQVLAALEAQGPARKNSHRTIDVLLYWVEHAPTMEELAMHLGKSSIQATKQRIYEMRKQIEQLCYEFCGHLEFSLKRATSSS